MTTTNPTAYSLPELAILLRHWGEKFCRLLWPWTTLLVAASLLLVAGLLAVNSVDTDVSDQDRAIISTLDVDKVCHNLQGFNAELRCISALHDKIFRRFPNTNDAFKKGQTRHRIADYVARGYGSCYDRALLIEQALRHYGFEMRRVAIYERTASPLGYLRPGIQSHALSEVKTSRGWMVVESIDPLLGVDDDQQLYSIADIRAGLEDETIDATTFGIAIPATYMEGDFVYIYGVYSRHGYFFEPHIPVPEVDWSQLGFR